MSATDASTLLRPGLLERVCVLLAHDPAADAQQSFGAGVGSACAGLGAHVCECRLAVAASVDDEADSVERVATQATGQAAAEAGAVELLVLDAASVFSRVSEDPLHADRREAARDALRACLDVSWNVTRVVAERAFLPESRGGRIVYLAPRADAGEHADAARAGLENLARTLSIEWARHGVTAVAIAPGVASSAEVAALTAYLASPAGAYFSGCLLDLRGP
jgi:NAD(P)-dependent dehydrogenase (short-subunit alcohol dehydrogenase family)